MKQRHNLKVILILIAFCIATLSQFIGIVGVRAASIASGQEFFTGRSDICMSRTCDALVQWGINQCVITAATNPSNYINGGFNGGYSAFMNATNNDPLLNSTGYHAADGYTFLESLFAYYYGVNAASNCNNSVLINKGLTNINSIASLDNIGAAFDMLSLLKGDNVASSYFTCNGNVQTSFPCTSYNSITLNNVISPLTDLMEEDAKANLICQQSQMSSELYNTAMDISSGSFDVGDATLDLNSKSMIGILQPQYANQCNGGSGGNSTNLGANRFQALVDLSCGNLVTAPVNPIQPKPQSNTCSISDSLKAENSTIKFGTADTFSINWTLPNPSQITSTTVTQTSTAGLGDGNHTPASLRYSVSTNSVGYNSNAVANTIEEKVNDTVTYSGSMVVAGVSTPITCTPDIVSWAIDSKPPAYVPPPSIFNYTSNPVCNNTLSPLNQAQDNYGTDYEAWYNYDQNTFQSNKTQTDADASMLQGPLSTFLGDAAAYNADVAAVAQIVQNYNNALSTASTNEANADTAAANLLPAQPTYEYYPATPPEGATAAQVKAYNIAYNAVTSANATISKNYTNTYNAALPGYKAAITAATTAYNNAVTNAKNLYYAQYNPAFAKEAPAATLAEGAYAAMQKQYQPWLKLSEVTYNTTTLYSGTPPFSQSTYTNNNSYYNQDLNLYNTVQSDLSAWQSAQQQEVSACDTQPYISVTGGDVAAGIGIANSNNSCSSNNSANISGSNLGASSWTGASDNLSAIATGVIDGFSTGTGGNQLTFANTVSQPYGGSFNSTLGECTQDYYGTSSNVVGYSGLNPISGQFNLANISNYVNTNNCVSTEGTYYCDLSNAIVSGNPPPGDKIVLYVAGNAEINNNISFYSSSNNAPLTSASDIPLLYVIASGNIYIDSTVTSIDGVYSAVNTIYTCANSGTPFYSDSSLIGACNSALTVHGSLVASQVKFGRVSGGLPNAGGWPTGASENFNYGPEVWLTEVNGTMQVNPSYDDLNELSPIV